MVHPQYYIYLSEMINKIDEIISYNIDQPVINKKLLKDIGIEYENLHFIDYLQLYIQIKDRVINNKIKSLIHDSN